MFQLYKKRNFNLLINDTFLFFKVSGKNYLKAFFTINGIFLLALIVLIYIVGHLFIDTLLSAQDAIQKEAMLENYFMDNMAYFIGTGLVISVLLIIISLLSYSFPVLYLKAMEKHETPTTTQIVALLKVNAGKIILFAILSLFTFIPIAILLIMISALLVVLLIGIPLLFLVAISLTSWLMLSFYDYLSTDNDYFTSMSKGSKMLLQNYWRHAGATGVFIIITYILQMIVSVIPYSITAFSIITDSSSPDKFDFSFLSILLMSISILVSYIFSNLNLVNQGMIYYSCMEQNENHSARTEIDLIGKDFE